MHQHDHKEALSPSSPSEVIQQWEKLVCFAYGETEEKESLPKNDENMWTTCRLSDLDVPISVVIIWLYSNL
jgi:hypothetical protein